MENLVKKFNQKLNGAIWSFVGTGIILILLAIVIMWEEMVFRLMVALFILLVAYTFIYAGYKLWTIKEEIEKHLKLK